MAETTAIAIVSPEERAEREREGQGIVVAANEIQISDGDTFTKAAAWLRDVVVPMKKRISDTFRPRINQAFELHKGLLADEKRFLSPVEGAERVVRGKLAAYEAEQDRLRREAAAAARREQERLEALERQRVETERQRLAKEAEDKRLTEAVQAEQRGDVETAERLISAPIETPVVAPRPVFAPPPTVQAPPKVEGLSFREEWDFEIENVDQLPRDYLKPDEVKIRSVVKAMKGQTKISGVRVFSKRVPSVRG
jgi:hypothetical protein